MITASMHPGTMGLPVVVIPTTAPDAAAGPADVPAGVPDGMTALGSDLARHVVQTVLDADVADPSRVTRERDQLFARLEQAIKDLPTAAEPEIFDKAAADVRADIAAAGPRLEWLDIREAAARAHRRVMGRRR